MAESVEDTLRGIYNFRQLAPDLATAGQPLEDELSAVAAAGFEVVINLALLDADYSLPDEPGLVRSLGMEFEHVPVIWEHPTLADLQAFFAAMGRHAGRRIFLHCAANMRASVFLALYRILQLGWPQDAAMAQVRDIWEPDVVWAAFIKQALANRAAPL
jgi:protein tyrosine phosphatase (PTP) superfamily phosphohydrolase (DUF442 family)